MKNHDHPIKKLEGKIKRREKKKMPKAKVSGKSALKLKKIIEQK